jgi:arginine decarboxylase
MGRLNIILTGRMHKPPSTERAEILAGQSLAGPNLRLSKPIDSPILSAPALPSSRRKFPCLMITQVSRALFGGHFIGSTVSSSNTTRLIPTRIRVPTSSTDTTSTRSNDRLSSEATASQPNTHASSLTNEWSIEEARETYGLRRWGNGYFEINDSGQVIVNAPTANGVQSVAMTDIIDGLQQQGLETPVMLRLENLVDDRIVRLNEAFASAIAECKYQSDYRGVFPIKVNQQCHVIDSIAKAGQPFGHGFEAGSKAELLIAMSTVPSRDSLIVCNGYKDEEFIDLGFQALRLGYQCFFVAESLEEIDLMIRRAQHWAIDPLIGVRIKLATRVDGHWAGDSGDRSLFGLNAVDLIKAVDRLRESNMLKCLQMLHFHLGSQIPNIRNVRDGVKEACRYYVDLISDGAPLGYLDLGGGLAVDYDGTESTEAHSRNYDLNEYCVDIVETIMNSLDRHQVPHPRLVSESGRWTVAPMSVLLFNVLTVTDFEPTPIPDPFPQDTCQPIQDLLYTLEHLQLRRLQENYNDAIYYRDQMRDQFRTGTITLRQRALGENVCLTILNRIATMVPQLRRVPAGLSKLRDSLSDIYYGNFSVFQSLPDAWAIQQIFPVMPIHRLHEKPDRQAIIADLTCDCDGKLDRFTDRNGDVSRTLPLHKFHPDQAYYLGVFLVGAYQETLGDLHNLFGDTHVASVRISENGNIEFEDQVQGDTISDVLSYVEYQPEKILERFLTKVDQGVHDQAISESQKQEMIRLFRDSLQGYTYFER